MRKLIAEAVGTFALVFAGTGAVVINEFSGGAITHVGIALTFGLIVLAMIYAIGGISGAHLNPAVTFGFWLAGRFNAKDIPGYLVAQAVGAFAASLILKVSFPNHATLGATLPNIGIAGSFWFETILTFLLMYVIINVATGSKEQGLMAGIAIGATVALEALFAGPATGASMNPIRSIAPGLVSGATDGLWLYIAAPLLGAALAVFLHMFICGKGNACKVEP